MSLRRFGFGRVTMAAAAAILVALPVALSAQDEDRRRAVGDWLVEDVYDENDGSRTVRMVREDGDYSLDFHLNMGPNAGDFESQGFMVWRLTCGQGGEESLDGGRAGLQAPAIRARLAAYLERCSTPAAEVASQLRDFDRAFALLTEWAASVPDTMTAEMNMADEAGAYLTPEEMAAGGNDMIIAVDMNMADMDMDVNMTSDMDMDMDMVTDATDMNMTTDYNSSEESWTNSTTDEPN